jgi:hypothetical protein
MTDFPGFRRNSYDTQLTTQTQQKKIHIFLPKTTNTNVDSKSESRSIIFNYIQLYSIIFNSIQFNTIQFKMMASTESDEKAEEMRKRDAEKLNARKKKFDAARFAHIEKTNQRHGQPTVVVRSSEPGDNNDNKKETVQEKNKRKGWGIFSKKKNNNNNAEDDDTTTTTIITKSIKSPPPIAARSVKPTNVPQSVSAGWASIDKQNERTLPVVHSSEPNYPRPPELSSSTTTATTNSSSTRKKNSPEKPIFKTVGYGTTPTNDSKNNNNAVSSTITNFGGSIKTKMGDPRQMSKQPKVSSSTSESMDNYGNITRTITRQIKDPSTGKTTTETEIIEIPSSNKK